MQMSSKPELFFKTSLEWRSWLDKNHDLMNGVYLIFYTVKSGKTSMRWEEAVKVALCYGWIDSTVKNIDHESRRQYFCPRNPKSVWSKLNKSYIAQLIDENLMHQSGLEKIEAAKQDSSWTALDDVENLVIPEDLQTAFDKNKIAHENYQNFAKTYKKGYLYWLNQAKRIETRFNRINQIIELCEKNLKHRQ